VRLVESSSGTTLWGIQIRSWMVSSTLEASLTLGMGDAQILLSSDGFNSLSLFLFLLGKL
jgi:hypothetical protein